MDTEKQKKVIECLKTGKYGVNIYNGEITKYYVAKATWKVMTYNNINNYRQYKLFPGRGKGGYIMVYGHHIVWLFANGLFDPNLVIDHDDNIRSNNKLSNLRLVTNSYNKKKSPTKNNKKDLVRIKGKDIIELVRLYDETNNYKEVERITGFKRTTIMYLVKKYKSGKPMRYL